MTRAVREVEYYRLWGGNSGDGGTLDTDFIEIPANTPYEQLDQAVQEAAATIEWSDDPPVIVGGSLGTLLNRSQKDGLGRSTASRDFYWPSDDGPATDPQKSPTIRRAAFSR